MCILNDDRIKVKNGPLKLWKVIRKDNGFGIWGDTRVNYQFYIEKMFYHAHDFLVHSGYQRKVSTPGQFHCFFTRKEARKYVKYHNDRAKTWGQPNRDTFGHVKIIKVSADSSHVVNVGQDEGTGIRAISVSQMRIDNLNHQR